MALAFSAAYPAAGAAPTVSQARHHATAQLPQNWCDRHPNRCGNNNRYNDNTRNNNGQTCYIRETIDINGNYVKTTICR
ncbi:hypothetical protein [Streptomyces sp. NPDC054834]